MAIEYVLADGVEELRELVIPGTNIKLPGKEGLDPNGDPYNEWYLRVETLDQVIIFFFGAERADFRWVIDEDNLNQVKKTFRVYESADCVSLYQWRPSTPDEISKYSNNPNLKTNIPKI